MTELKTLKDLENDRDETDREIWDSVDRTELKQEAVKWAKSLRIKSKGISPGNPDVIFLKDMGLHEWIKKFFNITEEDLK